MLPSQRAAQVSHDLRMPLTSIAASLEMLEEVLGEDRCPAATELLDCAARAADRMLRMLEQNMAVDSVPVGGTRRDVDLDEVVTQLTLDSSRFLEAACATLEVGPLPVVHGDPDELYSVMQNLLTNAVKFTQPGVRPWVWISARQVPCGWRISVRDNGIGIPAEHRVDVFRLFSRVDSKVEGHGIGLATVAHTVLSLGGRVGADDAPGGGAEVWLELPASANA